MTIHGKDPSLLRRINEATTTRVLYDRETLTLTKVVGATGLSSRTAELVLDGLIERGLVEQIDPGGGGSVGRPPARLGGSTLVPVTQCRIRTPRRTSRSDPDRFRSASGRWPARPRCRAPW